MGGGGMSAGAGGMGVRPLQWIAIPGGTFAMGSMTDIKEQPVHDVTVPNFDMTQTEITVAQYMQCVTDTVCTNPGIWSTDCYWNSVGFDNYPVNCVDWDQAAAFCDWAGGRLPSEAEWEYAARSAGQPNTYPWGEDPATCDLAVKANCTSIAPEPVCSKIAGNTAQDLCDMAGNVFEWTQDTWHDTYDGAPNDGSAWEGGNLRLIRGGDYQSDHIRMQTFWRGEKYEPIKNDLFLGLRCARNGQ
jgi:formylglycine-generating enzyme required for sulfatase activity